MESPRYADPLTLAQALSRFFRENGFDDSGGYGRRVFWLGLRWLRVPVPNIAARVRAVRLHDGHHVAGDFPTTWRGEAEIGAWELGGGCGPYWVAWWLDLYAVAVGLPLWPRALWRAFLRGRRSRNLYHGASLDGFLEQPLARLREFLADPGDRVEARSSDRIAFLAAIAASLAWAALSGLAVIALAAALWLLWRRAVPGMS